MNANTSPHQPSADTNEQAAPELSPSDRAWAARVAAMAYGFGVTPRGVRRIMAGFPSECVDAAVSALAALRAS
jgi:hypothetical protein